MAVYMSWVIALLYFYALLNFFIMIYLYNKLFNFLFHKEN